jgi:hypothetical protein
MLHFEARVGWQRPIISLILCVQLLLASRNMVSLRSIPGGNLAILSPAFVHSVEYRLRLLDLRDTLPPSYLFLCPAADFQPDIFLFHIPECPAYWSFDPSGVHQLGTEAAKDLGFPTMDVPRRVRARSWDDSTYAEIRQFHEVKGFAPRSPLSLAMEEGISLYHVSCGMDTLFAHSEPIINIIPTPLMLK